MPPPQKIPFDRRILVIGCGAVSQCALPLFLDHLDMPGERITVLEMADNRAFIADALKRGVRYVQERITREQYREQLARHAGPGDIIVDLAWNLGCTDLLDWCYQNQVRYLNTSVE